MGARTRLRVHYVMMLPSWPTTWQNKSTCSSCVGIWVPVAAHTNAFYYMLLTVMRQRVTCVSVGPPLADRRLPVEMTGC
jgi:hypothetical protein